MNTDREFNVLGQKIRLAESSGSGVLAVDVLALVERGVDKIRILSSRLDDTQIAVLVALKLAEDKLALEREYCNSVDEFQMKAKEVLEIIEDTSILQ